MEALFKHCGLGALGGGGVSNNSWPFFCLVMYMSLDSIPFSFFLSFFFFFFFFFSSPFFF